MQVKDLLGKNEGLLSLPFESEVVEDPVRHRTDEAINTENMRHIVTSTTVSVYKFRTFFAIHSFLSIFYPNDSFSSESTVKCYFFTSLPPPAGCRLLSDEPPPCPVLGVVPLPDRMRENSRLTQTENNFKSNT